MARRLSEVAPQSIEGGAWLWRCSLSASSCQSSGGFGASTHPAVRCEERLPSHPTKSAERAPLTVQPPPWGTWSKRVVFPDRGALYPSKVFSVQFCNCCSKLVLPAGHASPPLPAPFLLQTVPGLEIICETCALAQLVAIHLHWPEHLRLVGGSRKGSHGLASVRSWVRGTKRGSGWMWCVLVPISRSPPASFLGHHPASLSKLCLLPSLSHCRKGGGFSLLNQHLPEVLSKVLTGPPPPPPHALGFLASLHAVDFEPVFSKSQICPDSNFCSQLRGLAISNPHRGLPAPVLRHLCI